MGLIVYSHILTLGFIVYSHILNLGFIIYSNILTLGFIVCVGEYFNEAVVLQEAIHEAYQVQNTHFYTHSRV